MNPVTFDHLNPLRAPIASLDNIRTGGAHADAEAELLRDALQAILTRYFPEECQHIVYIDISLFDLRGAGKTFTFFIGPDDATVAGYLEAIGEMLAQNASVGTHAVFREGLPVFRDQDEREVRPSTLRELEDAYHKQKTGIWKLSGDGGLETWLDSEKEAKRPIPPAGFTFKHGLRFYAQNPKTESFYQRLSRSSVMKAWEIYGNALKDQRSKMRSASGGLLQYLYATPVGIRTSDRHGNATYTLLAMVYFGVDHAFAEARYNLAELLQHFVLRLSALQLGEIRGRWQEESKQRHRLPGALAAVVEDLKKQGMEPPASLLLLQLHSFFSSETSAPPALPWLEPADPNDKYYLGEREVRDLYKRVARLLAKQDIDRKRPNINQHLTPEAQSLLRGAQLFGELPELEYHSTASLSFGDDVLSYRAVAITIILLLAEAAQHSVFSTARMISDGQTQSLPRIIITLAAGEFRISNYVYPDPKVDDFGRLESGNLKWEVERMLRSTQGQWRCRFPSVNEPPANSEWIVRITNSPVNVNPRT